MKLKEIISLSFLNFRANKFKSKVYISIMSILITIIICMSSGINSLNRFNNNYLNGDFRYRTIGVEVLNNNNKEIKEKLEKQNIKYVSTIFENNNVFSQTVRIKGGKGSINLYGKYSGINYTINSGRDIQNDNEIICSSKFYAGNWTTIHDEEKYTDLTKQLGQKIKITYDKEHVIADYQSELLGTYEHELELVGTFDVSKDLTEYDICYVSTNFFEKVVDENSNIYSDYYLSQLKNEVYVLVDSYKNVEYVKKVLSDNGYNLEMYYEMDLEPFYLIEEIINKASIVIIIISSICAFLFIRSTIIESNKNIALYELLGYKKKDIKLIFLFQYLINLVISFIIGIVISHIIRIIIVSILSKDPNYSILNIFISYKEGLLYFMIVSIITLLSIILLFATKIKKNSPIKLMEGKL